MKLSKRDYQKELKKLIKEKGYWSKEVCFLNDCCIALKGHNVYVNWKNEVLQELRNQNILVK